MSRHHRGTPVALALVVPVVPGPLDPQLLVTSSPFSDRALGGVLLAAPRVALAVTALAVVVAGGAVPPRPKGWSASSWGGWRRGRP